VSAQPIAPDPTIRDSAPNTGTSGRGTLAAVPGQSTVDAQVADAGAAAPLAEAGQRTCDGHHHTAGSALSATLGQAGYDQLGVLAASFADAMATRIQIGNRLGSGTVPPDVVAAVLARQQDTEKLLGKAMRQAFRRVAPDVYAWQQSMPGVGEHLVARLLGAIGHPVIATPHHWQEPDHTPVDSRTERVGSCQDHRDGTGRTGIDALPPGAGPSRILVADPPFIRNVAKLWAYCGHGDPARRRRRGMSADEGAELGSPQAKMLVRLIASKAVMEPGRHVSALFAGEQHPAEALRPYRRLYEEARLKYRGREDWSEKRRENAALRLVGKRMLRDLWLAARPGIEA